MSVSTGKRARSTGRGGRRVVLAGRGKDWELWIPEDDYQRMSEAERAAAVERQRALVEGQALAAGARPGRRRGAGRGNQAAASTG